jgi:N-acetylglucosamine malate deacetylase 2
MQASEAARAARNANADALIAALLAPADVSRHVPRTMVVGAHPDDETAFVGVRLARLKDAQFVCVTDGSPRDGVDAARNGMRPHEYAQARVRELDEILGSFGIAAQQIRRIAYTDQEAALHLAELARRLAGLFIDGRTEAVLTHPYEGGHPDHDATAFGVHAAAALLSREGEAPPAIVEMACYHGSRQGLRGGEFVFGPDEGAVVHLTPEEQQRKRALLDRFATQRHTLPYLPVEVECFRRAPAYDFTQPPHAGELWYERMPWGWSGERFRTLVAQALAELGLEGPL